MSCPSIEIDPTAQVSQDARIHGSVRGTKIKIGAHSRIYDFVVIRAVGGEGDVVVGEHCYLNPGTVIYSGNGVVMGNYVLVAPNVSIMATNHQYSSRMVPMRVQGFMPSRGGITIGNDVWIGANAVILDGANIAEGAIVAAGAVVNSAIGPYEIWGGVPARKLKER